MREYAFKPPSILNGISKSVSKHLSSTSSEYHALNTTSSFDKNFKRGCGYNENKNTFAKKKNEVLHLGFLQ